jgi:hypothetical protein
MSRLQLYQIRNLRSRDRDLGAPRLEHAAAFNKGFSQSCLAL